MVVELGSRTVIKNAVATPQTTMSGSHTVFAATKVLTALVIVEGNELDLGCSYDGNAMTLHSSQARTGANRDLRILTYYLLNPDVGTATGTYTNSGNHAPGVLIFLNWDAVDITDPITLLTDVQNTSSSNTSVLASGGTSGNLGLVIAGCQGFDGTPASIDEGFTILENDNTASDGSDLSFLLASKQLTGAVAPTVTWLASDQNSAMFLELNLASIGPKAMYHYRNHGKF